MKLNQADLTEAKKALNSLDQLLTKLRNRKMTGNDELESAVWRLQIGRVLLMCDVELRKRSSWFTNLITKFRKGV